MSSRGSELRVLLLTLEYAEPWIFSGNGVYSRSFVHNLIRTGDTRIQVICGRPAGQPIRPRPQSANHGSSSSSPAAAAAATSHREGVEVIKEGGKIDVYTVSLPVWFRLDRHSSWKEFGEGAARFAKVVAQFQPDVVLGVDWTSRLAWETLKKQPGSKLQSVPFVYLCFRVFSSTPGLSQEDRTFYAQREAETIQSAVRTVALSRCDAVALDALRTMTLPRGAEALRASASLIQVIAPPLRDDVRNASLKLARIPQSVSGYQRPLSSRKKWSWAHSQISSANHPPPFPGSMSSSSSSSISGSEGSSFASRIFITCCCRISPEKEIMRFVEIVENIQRFLKDNELVPYIVGPPADEEYARKVYQRLKRAFPGDTSIIVSDFVPADRLQSIFAKTLLNIHPARMEPFGMTITEAAAFGVPTLLDGGGLIGATDVLPYTESCSIACNLKSIKQASLTVKSLLRKEGRSFLEIVGKRAQDAVLRWGSAEWALHVRKELLDDVLKNAFRAYNPRAIRSTASSGFVSGGIVTMKDSARSKDAGGEDDDDDMNGTDEHAHDGDETWPWIPITEWVATQLSLQSLAEGRVLDFDLDGVKLVVEQLLKLSAISLASLLLNIKHTKSPLPVDMDADMYEWAWYLLSKHSACLGPARFRLVPSRMSEDAFWGLLFAVIRDGVVRLVTRSSSTSAGLMMTMNNDETFKKNKSLEFLSPGEEFRKTQSSPQPMMLEDDVPDAGEGKNDKHGDHRELPSFTSPLDAATEAMERLIQRDECARGISPIVDFVGKGVLGESAQALFSANKVLILTGFPCLLNAPNPQETDGPPGAVAIAKACVSLGKRVMFVVEDPIADVLRAAIVQVFPKTRTMLLRAHDEGLSRVETFGSKGQVTMEVFPPKARFTAQHDERLNAILTELSCDQSHMVAIERAGPCSDGSCRTMRGRVMGDDLLAPFHVLFEKARQFNIFTTGIGDGGNEVGMGAAYDVVRTKINPQIACVVGCDYLLPCSLSNWGGYALAAALALVALQHETKFHGPHRHQKVLEACIGSNDQLEKVAKACVDAGGGDGVNGNRDSVTVDGLPFSKSLEVVEGLRRLVESYEMEGNGNSAT